MSGSNCNDLDHCECVDSLYRRIAELEARLSEAHGAIKEFTHHTRFAADIWKQQSYIQPLFDVDEALNSTAQVRLGKEGE